MNQTNSQSQSTASALVSHWTDISSRQDSLGHISHCRRAGQHNDMYRVRFNEGRFWLSVETSLVVALYKDKLHVSGSALEETNWRRKTIFSQPAVGNRLKVQSNR